MKAAGVSVAEQCLHIWIIGMSSPNDLSTVNDASETRGLGAANSDGSLFPQFGHVDITVLPAAPSAVCVPTFVLLRGQVERTSPIHRTTRSQRMQLLLRTFVFAA